MTTPELQAAVERLQRFTSGESGYAVYPGGIFITEGPSPFYADLRLILAALEERGKALEAYEAAKDRIAADSYDGIDDRSRELLETASQLARFAITALGGTADV